MEDPDVWPIVLDLGRDECKRILRRLELEAYSNLVSVLRAQGSLTSQKRRLLQNVAQTLSISEERHKAECRRAVNSEKLATIAKHMGGANSGTEWAIEGRRLVPLLPRLVPQTAFTAIADKIANMAMTEGAKLPLPAPPVKKRLVSPPIDETLLEPSVPEDSKTVQISSGSPLSVIIPSSEVQAGNYHSASPQFSAGSPQLYQGPSSEVLTAHPSKSHIVLSSMKDSTKSLQVKTEVSPRQVHEASAGQRTVQSAAVAPSATHHAQPSMPTPQPQTAQKPQVVLLVKKEEKSQDERLSRKRPRSASLDMALNVSQGSMMPPPSKKEAVSPLSPVGMGSPLSQLPSTISPQSHSHLVQQQTLQAAAAAVAAAARSSPTPTTQNQQHTQALHHVYQQPLQLQPHQQQYPTTLTPQPTAPVPQPQQQHLPQHIQQHHISSPSMCQSQSSSSSTSSGRTITIPSQGTVKLSLSSGTSNTGSSISSSTHKVIIVSSTTPSILQRSLSVPVVKSLSTSAPSQPCSSTLVLNTAQQTKSSAFSSSSTPESSSSPSPQQGASTVPNKIQGKIMTQSAPKTRPRANSIVIPVTPNQTNMMSGVGVTNVPLKTGLQTGKHGINKSSDSAGLKIMPLASVSKLSSKTTGSSPMYVVSSTSTTNSAVSMVARTVSAGPRVMTLASNVPKVAVSSGQSGTVLSMTAKSAQTIQLAQASGVMTTASSIPLASGSGKPNVIVVQKGSTAFGRGVSLPHGSKEVVGKVLLGGKALTTLNQSQATNSMQIQSASSSSLYSLSNLPSSQSQAATSQTPVLPSSSSASTRVVTVQKVPSAVVQGAASSGNVIVLDLSQEQLNNSAVLNEILASSILQSSNVMSFNHSNISETTNIPASSLKGLINFPSEQTGSDSGLLLSEGSFMVDELGSLSRNDICGMEDGIANEYSDALSHKNESIKSCIAGEGSIYGEPSSSSATSLPRGRTDICATAISNANLNLNDFLDDNSIDDIQSISLDGMRMDISSGTGNVSTNPNMSCHTDETLATWTASEDTSTTSTTSNTDF